MTMEMFTKVVFLNWFHGIGQLCGEQKSGTGDYHGNSNYFYSGQWVNDKKHGKGKETDNMGNIYEGEFVNDLKEGYGNFFWVEIFR